MKQQGRRFFPKLVRKVISFLEWYVAPSYNPVIATTAEYKSTIYYLFGKLKNRELIERYNATLPRKERITPPLPDTSKLQGIKLFLYKRVPCCHDFVSL